MAYTTINKSTDYFNTKLYTGNGSTNAITGVGFQPDWTWIKNRSTAGEGHHLYDAVRGVTKRLRSDTTAAESTDSTGLTTFGTDGFTVGSNDGCNKNSVGIVSWNWKANGAGSANSDGSQSSTVSVNTTAGFSIVKFVNNQSYTTNTFGHGLGVVPKVIIMRSLDSAYNWDVYHHKVGNDKRLILNSANAEASSTYMNSTSPTNQVFTVKSDEFDTNDDCIAYCFAEKIGYSKFGSYNGNGNADGTFVYTGFKPNWVMIKETNGSGAWRIYDSQRPTYNDKYGLMADVNDVEETGTNRNKIDQLSNGFKLRMQYDDTNGTSGQYVYMAFGQSLVGSNNVPCTAR